MYIQTNASGQFHNTLTCLPNTWFPLCIGLFFKTLIYVMQYPKIIENAFDEKLKQDFSSFRSRRFHRVHLLMSGRVFTSIITLSGLLKILSKKVGLEWKGEMAKTWICTLTWFLLYLRFFQFGFRLKLSIFEWLLMCFKSLFALEVFHVNPSFLWFSFLYLGKFTDRLFCVLQKEMEMGSSI